MDTPEASPKLEDGKCSYTPKVLLSHKETVIDPALESLDVFGGHLFCHNQRSKSTGQEFLLQLRGLQPN